MTATVGHDRQRTSCEGVAESRNEAMAAVRTAWERSKIVDGSNGL